jgi:DNA-binding transcriptional LysR family regulator
MTALDLRSLRYFVAVAEARSVGKAAIRLNMAQPPLSVHIKNLEAALGTPLFRRAAHGMEITDAGSALLTRAREALLLANEGFDAARAIGSGRRGRITVGTMFVLSYLLLPKLAEQLRLHLPDVEVQYVELNAANNVSALIDATVTVALCIPPIVHPDILVERMGSQRLMLAVRSDSPFAKRGRIPVKRLAGVPLIALPVPEGNAERSVVTPMLRRHDVTMPVVQRVETAMSALALVLADKGCAILPACAQLGCPPGVVFRHFQDDEATMEIAACWRSTSDHPLIASFLQCARTAIDAVA